MVCIAREKLGNRASAALLSLSVLLSEPYWPLIDSEFSLIKHFYKNVLPKLLSILTLWDACSACPSLWPCSSPFSDKGHRTSPSLRASHQFSDGHRSAFNVTHRQQNTNHKCRLTEFASDVTSELQKFYVKCQNKFPNKYTLILSILSAPDCQIQETLAETLCLHKATIKVAILGDFALTPYSMMGLNGKDFTFIGFFCICCSVL